MRSEGWSEAQISELARRFNVSREAILRRLLTFDRTTNSFYRASVPNTLPSIKRNVLARKNKRRK